MLQTVYVHIFMLYIRCIAFKGCSSRNLDYLIVFSFVVKFYSLISPKFDLLREVKKKNPRKILIGKKSILLDIFTTPPISKLLYPPPRKSFGHLSMQCPTIMGF